MYIKEYEKVENQFSFYTIWGYFIDNGILLNKNGSLQATFKIRGKDLNSSTPLELNNMALRINNIFIRLENFTFHIEARRQKSEKYIPSKNLKEIPVKIIEKERESFFKSGHHYESEYFLNINYLPPYDSTKKALSFFIEKEKEEQINTGSDNLKFFKEKILEITLAFNNIFEEFKLLTSEESLNYLHSQVTDKPKKIQLPKTHMLLDSYICDTDLIGGLTPILGEEYISCVSMYSFPNQSYMGILDQLNKLNISYRWVTRYISLDKKTALDNLESYQRKWFAKRKSMKQLLVEIFTNKESRNLDEVAISNASSIKDLKNSIQLDNLSLGYYTSCIVLQNKDKEILHKNSMDIIKIINSMEFTGKIETTNSLEAYFSTLSGDTIHNIRRPLVSSINLIHFLPFSSIWAGEKKNKHLNEASLIYTQTTGNTPFRFNIHIKDVGHTMMVGRTGSGKSVHLNMIACQFKKYKDSQVFIFDKGRSSQVLTKSIGGKFYNLGEESLGFQPFAKVDQDKEKEFIKDWLELILAQENFNTKPQDKATIWEAINSLAEFPEKNRTFTTFVTLLQDQMLKEVFIPYTNQGSYGKYFDCDFDSLEDNSFQSFELEKIAHKALVMAPLLDYLFHRIEVDKLNGSPTLIILDECWLFLNNPQFEAKIEEWLRVLRKSNASVVFATQELHDIDKSNITDIIKDSCQTKIYLPNLEANSESNKEIYKRFGLNEREIEILSYAEPKRDYYYKSPLGTRLYQLALSPLELVFVASSSVEDIKKVDEFQDLSTKEFNINWLNYKGYNGENILNEISTLKE